jgi:hypothetical protein
MKSFAKIGLLFALIITGRYLQPAASPVAATTTTTTPTAHRTLPLALARYTNPPQAEQDQNSQVPPQQPSGYFL